MPRKQAPTSLLSPVAWCQKSGRRATASRRTIFSVVERMPDYFDAEQLMAECRKQRLKVSRASIYRNLPLLCKASLLRVTEFGSGRHVYKRYTPNETPSAELYVVDKGQVIEIPAPFMTWYARSLASKVGLELLNHRLQIFVRSKDDKTTSGKKSLPQSS